MGAGRGIPPRYALQGTRNTREVGERHTLWTFVTREAGRYTRALGREVRLFLALVTFSLRALIFTAAEALSLSLSLSLRAELGVPAFTNIARLGEWRSRAFYLCDARIYALIAAFP